MTQSCTIKMRRLLMIALLSPPAPVIAAPQTSHASQAQARAAAASRETIRKCEALRRLVLDDATISAASFVPAGEAKLPAAYPGWAADQDRSDSARHLPGFCRVNVTMTPETGSAIGVEVWLPANWNGRFLGTGNGGGAGALAIDEPMYQNLKRGFAVANTDLGTAPNILTTMGQPMRWRDFGYRANHEMVRASRAFMKAYYGKSPKFSYFTGCSTGGQQAIVNATRYPEDYDGILLAAPGNDRTHLEMSFIWSWNALVTTPNSKLTEATLDYVHSQVIKDCGGGKDGGAPGDTYLTDPKRCTFDVDSLRRCAKADEANCVTDAQALALRKLYTGMVNPRTGERIAPPVTIGSEAMAGVGPLAQEKDDWPPQQFYELYWVFGRDKFNPATFDYDKDVDRVDGELAGILNANNVDVSRFRQRGGKMLMYHGLSDPAVSYEYSVDWYERLVAATGGDLTAVQKFARLFLIPGMDHCYLGPGAWNIGQDVAPGTENDPNRDALIALVNWVEKGRVPAQLVGTRFEDGDSRKRTEAQRPVCPYPQLPIYQRGNPSLAASFKCETRERAAKFAVTRRYLN